MGMSATASVFMSVLRWMGCAVPHLVVQGELEQDALALEADVVEGETRPGVGSHVALPVSPPASNGQHSASNVNTLQIMVKTLQAT